MYVASARRCPPRSVRGRILGAGLVMLVTWQRLTRLADPSRKTSIMATVGLVPEWSKKTMNCSHAQQISENVQLPTEPAHNKEEDQSPVKLSTLPGAKTSDFYSVKNIPERFNHPGTHLICAINPHSLLIRFLPPDWFEGYNTKDEHPFFSTSSSTYG